MYVYIYTHTYIHVCTYKQAEQEEKKMRAEWRADIEAPQYISHHLHVKMNSLFALLDPLRYTHEVCLAFRVCILLARERESERARERESERARERESERAREQESKRAREYESKRVRE